MAYTNQILAVAAAVLLAVAIAPRLADAQSEMFPQMTPECATVLPDLLNKCFTTVRETPTEECCSSLKSASTKEVSCLCINYIANPTVVNITGPYSAGITKKCSVFDKYSCDGTSKGGEEKKEGGSNSNGNGGATSKVAALMAVFALVTNLVFLMF